VGALGRAGRAALESTERALARQPASEEQTLARHRLTLSRTQASNGTISTTTAMKKDIHPKFYPEAKARRAAAGWAAGRARGGARADPLPVLAQIFCNGVEVMACGGTKPEYIVDVWSGNHPFYQGNKSTMVIEDGRVNRFNKMYADLADTLGNVATINSPGAGAGGDDAAPAASAAPTKAAPKAAAKGGKKK
jgi:ribosomal protein L31